MFCALYGLDQSLKKTYRVNPTLGKLRVSKRQAEEVKECVALILFGLS